MHFWFIFEWDVGPHWDKHISRMARTEIRINDLFADRKKGVQSKDRGFATSPSGSRAGLSPQTNFPSNMKLLWFYKKNACKKVFINWQQSLQCYFPQQVEAVVVVRTHIKPTRWPSPTRSSGASSARAAPRLLRSGAAPRQSRPSLLRPRPNTSQMIWLTQKIPPKLETDTICHIVLPLTAVNIRMICDPHVQQVGTNIDQ